MQWHHMPVAQETFKSLFPKTYSAENPFYGFRDIAQQVFEVTEKSSLGGGYTNQMFATKLRTNVYQLHLGLCISYKESTRETAYVLIKCVYNAATGKLTQIEAQYAIGDYARKTSPLVLKRKTGTVETLYTEVALEMKGLLLAKIKGYWDGFTAYYSHKVKNMSGYYLD